MIAIDTSAFMAILLGEAERDQFRMALERNEQTIVSAGTLVEAQVVCERRGGPPLSAKLRTLIDLSRIAVVPFDAAQSALAHQAFVRYGKGSGHPAQLNFGDLFSYALAKSRGMPLLFKGDDFARTDIVSALA